MNKNNKMKSLRNIEKRMVADLKTRSKNPRKITGEALEKLKESISKHGLHDVIKKDIDGTILSGNQDKNYGDKVIN